MKHLLCLSVLTLLLATSFGQTQISPELWMYNFTSNKQLDTLRSKCHSFTNLTVTKIPSCVNGTGTFNDSVLLTPVLNSNTNAVFETGWWSINNTKPFNYSFFYKLSNGENGPFWHRVYFVDQNNQKILVDSQSHWSYTGWNGDVCRDYDENSVFLNLATKVQSGTYKIRFEFGGATQNTKLALDNVICAGTGFTNIGCLQNLPFVKSRLTYRNQGNGTYTFKLAVDPNTNDEIKEIQIQQRKHGDTKWEKVSKVTPKKKMNIVDDVLYEIVMFLF